MILIDLIEQPEQQLISMHSSLVQYRLHKNASTWKQVVLKRYQMVKLLHFTFLESVFDKIFLSVSLSSYSILFAPMAAFIQAPVPNQYMGI